MATQSESVWLNQWLSRGRIPNLHLSFVRNSGDSPAIRTKTDHVYPALLLQWRCNGLSGVRIPYPSRSVPRGSSNSLPIAAEDAITHLALVFKQAWVNIGPT